MRRDFSRAALDIPSCSQAPRAASSRRSTSATVTTLGRGRPSLGPEIAAEGSVPASPSV